jgi:hypothetical protein
MYLPLDESLFTTVLPAFSIRVFVAGGFVLAGFEVFTAIVLFPSITANRSYFPDLGGGGGGGGGGVKKVVTSPRTEPPVGVPF